MTNEKIIVVTIICLGGIALFFIQNWAGIIYGIILIIIGISIILLHNSDQTIEQRKDLNKTKSKK